MGFKDNNIGKGIAGSIEIGLVIQNVTDIFIVLIIQYIVLVKDGNGVEMKHNQR